MAVERVKSRAYYRPPSDPRRALAEVAADRGFSLVRLDRLLRRGRGYLNRYVREGIPRALNERDHNLLVDFLDAGRGGLGVRDLWIVD